MSLKRYTLPEWQAEAVRRFGADSLNWAFICPICKHVAQVRDWKAAGAPENAVAFSCVGRWTKDPKIAFPSGSPAFLKKNDARPGPCNYTGGGLFRLNPVEVVDPVGEVHLMFDFPPEPFVAERQAELVTSLEADKVVLAAPAEELQRRRRRAKGGAA